MISEKALEELIATQAKLVDMAFNKRIEDAHTKHKQLEDKRPKLECMICGARYVMITRHLREEHGLTPKEYRKKFKLPDSYRMHVSTRMKGHPK